MKNAILGKGLQISAITSKFFQLNEPKFFPKSGFNLIFYS